MEKITIVKNSVEIELEDIKAKISFKQLLDILQTRAMPEPDSCNFIYPHGVRKVWTRDAAKIFLLEIPWSVHRLSWISDSSPVPYGPDAEYVDRVLACPWILLFVAFVVDGHGRLVLDRRKNEIFFATKGPVTDLDDTDYLCYPTLLNCSKFREHEQDTKPLSWLCTQSLPVGPIRRIRKNDRRVTETFKALRSLIFEAPGNYSSEHHEETSWFTAQKQDLQQLRDVANWERESEKNPAFILKVPFRKVNLSCTQIADRLFNIMSVHSSPLSNANELIRAIFNRTSEADLIFDS